MLAVLTAKYLRFSFVQVAAIISVLAFAYMMIFLDDDSSRYFLSDPKSSDDMVVKKPQLFRTLPAVEDIIYLLKSR